MLHIIKQQIKEGLKDARFVFLAILILSTFLVNGLVFSEQYKADMDSWRRSVNETTRLLEQQTSNLQLLSNYEQTMVKRPSPLAFIAGGGEDRIPNSITVNAFRYMDPQTISRDNKVMPVVQSMDWIFIIGNLMTLLAVFISYNSVCGEKRDGTLALLLSNPVSRLQIFLGKYLGLLVVLVATLFVGAFLSLMVLLLTGALPFTSELVVMMAIVLLFAGLMLSLLLLLGMTVSSCTRRPAVSLVVLLVIWVVVVVAVPGIAWILSEQMVKVPSSFELGREMAAAYDAIWDSKPDSAQNLDGNLFSENYRLWAEAWTEVLAMRQLIGDDAVATQIGQSELLQAYASISPTGLLDALLHKVCTTGVEGFKSFYRGARRYQQQLLEFTVAMDRADDDAESPHIVYSQGNRSIDRMFSTKPVALSTVPRWHQLSSERILPDAAQFAFIELLILVLENLLVAAIGFVAFARYDPR